MEKFAYTTLCAIGLNSNITKLEQSLPIYNSNIDFSKIIPFPNEINYDFDTTNKTEFEHLKKWATLNWGTPYNGTIERLEKIYSSGSESYLIEIRTVYNEPTLILDKITKDNHELDYFIYNIDLFGSIYLGLMQNNSKEFLILSKHDENYGIQLNKKEIQKINLEEMNYLHWNFLKNNYLGIEIKEYLQSFQNK